MAVGTVPRVALRWPEEVAAALGVSDDFLRKHGLIALFAVWRIGSLRLVSLAELERVVSEHSFLTVAATDATG